MGGCSVALTPAGVSSLFATSDHITLALQQQPTQTPRVPTPRIPNSTDTVHFNLTTLRSDPSWRYTCWRGVSSGCLTLQRSSWKHLSSEHFGHSPDRRIPTNGFGQMGLTVHSFSPNPAPINNSTMFPCNKGTRALGRSVNTSKQKGVGRPRVHGVMGQAGTATEDMDGTAGIVTSRRD